MSSEISRMMGTVGANSSRAAPGRDLGRAVGVSDLESSSLASGACGVSLTRLST